MFVLTKNQKNSYCELKEGKLRRHIKDIYQNFLGGESTNFAHNRVKCSIKPDFGIIEYMFILFQHVDFIRDGHEFVFYL